MSERPNSPAASAERPAIPIPTRPDVDELRKLVTATRAAAAAGRGAYIFPRQVRICAPARMAS
jgi:hypothetical protein